MVSDRIARKTTRGQKEHRELTATALQAAHLSPMPHAEEEAAARTAARSRRAPDLWVAALSSISRDLAQRRRDPESPLPRP